MISKTAKSRAPATAPTRSTRAAIRAERCRIHMPPPIGRSISASVPITAKYGICMGVWLSDAAYAYSSVGIMTTEASVETAVIETLSARSAREK